jgi:flagellar motor switch protein FliG
MNEQAPLDPIRKAAIVLASLTPDLAAGLLARLDPDSARAIERAASRIGAVPPEIREAVLGEFRDSGLRRSRFGFEDIARLGTQDLAEAYREEDLETWAAALAGAPKDLRSRVISALPRPGAEALRRAASARFRVDDVSDAQDAVVRRLRQLHDLGLIALPEPAAGAGRLR